MKHLPSLLLSAVAALAPAEARCQGYAQATAPTPAQAHDQAEAPRGFDARAAVGATFDDAGVPWLIGHDYKAAFVDGAMHFVPALGERAPHDLPLDFRLQRITRGAELLHDCATGSAPPPTVTAHGVHWQRGAVREQYEATPAGVEQSFVFAVRPAGHGDLCVRGAIATELCPSSSGGAPLQFTDGLRGGVAIGGVTGVDALGRRCAGSVQFVDGALELRLPAAFVDAASYPLTLDPLYGTTILPGSATFDESEVAVAYERTAAVYLVVWSRTFSATDRNIRAQRVDDNGALVGGLIGLTSALGMESAPAVAAVDGRDRFVVCWQEGPSIFGPFDVRCRTVDAFTGATGAVVDVGANAASDRLPAICGDRDPTGSQALVAWISEGTGLMTCPVTVSSTGVATVGTAHLVQSTATVYSPPCWPKSRSGTANTVLCVDVVQGDALHTTKVYVIDTSGGVVGSPTTIALATQADGSNGCGLDGDGTHFLVASHGSIGNTVSLRQLTLNGGTLTPGNLTTLPTQSARGFAVGFVGDRFLVAWEEPTANPFAAEVHGVSFAPDCTACSQQFTVPTVAHASQRAPAIATHFGGGASGGDALLVWSEHDPLPPFGGGIAGQRFTTMIGAPPVQLGPGCAGGGTATTSGPFSPGSADFRFELHGGDPTAPFAILALGLGDPPIGCGCTFTSAAATFAKLALSGTASHAFPVPCDAQLLGFQLECQWLLFGVAASPCPFVPNLVASNRLLLTISP